MNKLVINRLKIYANHGVFDFEKSEGQNFYISCELYLREPSPYAIEDAENMDSIDHTVNYALVCELIKEHITQNCFDLIETVGNTLAVRILDEFPGLNGCLVRVDKPEAPIPMDFETVAYVTERKWHTVCLAIGSNMGNRDAYISNAIDSLQSLDSIRNIVVSDIITTKPYGGVEQDDFLNGAIVCETYLTPDELLAKLHEIEKEANRERKIHWGPRTLDLDILLYDEAIIHTSSLIIPHIDMQNRDFVLRPLAQIAPYAYHPVLRKTVSELWEELNK